MEFFSNSSENIVQRSETKRSENGARIELISGQQQGRSTARSTGVHKRAQGSLVYRGNGTVDRGSTDWHEVALGLSRSTDRSTEGQGR